MHQVRSSPHVRRHSAPHNMAMQHALRPRRQNWAPQVPHHCHWLAYPADVHEPVATCKLQAPNRVVNKDDVGVTLLLRHQIRLVRLGSRDSSGWWAAVQRAPPRGWPPPGRRTGSAGP